MIDVNQGTKVFTVAERVFNSKLSEEQRILAFDRYWQGYDLDGNAPKDEDKLYHYQPAPPSLQARLAKLALDAYVALGGHGYGRVDMRSDCYEDNKMKIYVLEVNANCGLSFDSSSSMGEILQMSREPINEFVENIVQVALGTFSSPPLPSPPHPSPPS
jgi:hypothetical protein